MTALIHTVRTRISPIVPVLILVGCYQLSLLGVGATSLTDEGRYQKAFAALSELRDGSVSGFLREIVTLEGRPGEAVVKLIPAALQSLPLMAELHGTPPGGRAARVMNPTSLMIATACNIPIMLTIIFALYRISLLLFHGDRMIASTAAGLYGSLVSTSLYVRHLSPYDWSLCLVVCMIWAALSRPPGPWFAFLAGMASAAAVAIYPGYYLVAGILGAVVVLRWPVTGPMAWIQRAAQFSTGAVTLLLGIEEVTRLAAPHAVSYLKTALGLSRTVVVGSFAEGWAFFPHYLLQVERYAGVLLMVGIGAFLARTVFDVSRGRGLRPIHALVLPAVAAWLWQAVASYHLHLTPLVGRLIHPWFLFLVLATADAVTWIEHRAARTGLCPLVALVAVVSWLPAARQYRRIAYPADVAYRLGVDPVSMDAAQKRCEMEPVGLPLEYFPPRDGRGDGSGYFLVNFCFGRPRPERFEPVPPPPGSTLVFDAPHFLTFPAYGFDASFVPEDRPRLTSRPYAIRAYTRPR